MIAGFAVCIYFLVLSGLLGLSGFSKSSFSALVIQDSLVKMFFSEVGPQNRGKIQFTVGDLPQQEVAYAQLSAGSDE